MKTPKSNTLILLIDFEGHPEMGDEYTNNLRFSKLLEMLEVKDRRLLIAAISGINSTKLEYIRKVCFLEDNHDWIDIDESIHVQDLINQCTDLGYNITNVIIGGTNTAGCVIRSKNISAVHLVRYGLDVQIYLPMCADYQMPGVNAIEKNILSFTVLYRFIKQYNIFDSIDIISHRGDLVI